MPSWKFFASLSAGPFITGFVTGSTMAFICGGILAWEAFKIRPGKKLPLLEEFATYILRK